MDQNKLKVKNRTTILRVVFQSFLENVEKLDGMRERERERETHRKRGGEREKEKRVCILLKRLSCQVNTSQK